MECNQLSNRTACNFSYANHKVCSEGGSDLDILVANCADVPTLMRNEGGNRNNWLQVLLQGVQSNRNALGARVELVSGDLRLVDQVRSGASYLSQSDMRLFFGLGTRRRVDRLEVLWPSGLVEAVEDLRVNQEITLTEGQQ